MGTREKQAHDLSRRNFLQVAGAGAPTVKLLLEASSASGQAIPSIPANDSHKFTPVNLSPYFNSSPTDFGRRENAKQLGGASAQDGLIRVPCGNRILRGIPFQLGPAGVAAKSWMVLSTGEGGHTTASVEIPLAKPAAYICVTSFCDWDWYGSPPGRDYMEKIGQLLGELQTVYDDGAVKSFPLRRKFEVNPPAVPWGLLLFTALSGQQDFRSKE
jgi:hypothetical protein